MVHIRGSGFDACIWLQLLTAVKKTQGIGFLPTVHLPFWPFGYLESEPGDGITLSYLLFYTLFLSFHLPLFPYSLLISNRRKATAWLNCQMNYSLYFLRMPFLVERIIYTKNCDYSNLGIWQIFSRKWIKWACHFKESNWQYLLSVIKSKYSSKS